MVSQEIRRQLEQLAGESGGKFTSEDVGLGLRAMRSALYFVMQLNDSF